jgi:hypothetical protein
MTDNAIDMEVQQVRVVKLTDGIMAILAGNDGAEAETALTLAVVTWICVLAPNDTESRHQAAEGFTRQVREFIRREDIVEWVKASIRWAPRAGRG